ncbi:MAG: HAD-IA family hydrolase, partial [Gammaproteobacteria bacterium]
MNFPQPSEVDFTQLDWVLLDMDGTLLDLYFDDKVWNQRLPERYAGAHNMPVEQAREAIQKLMAPIRGTLQWYCFENWQKMTGIDLMEIENEVYGYVQPRPGAIQFLQKLRSIPATIVLATNADRRSMSRKIAHTGIEQYFDYVISSHDFGYAKESSEFWSSLQAHLALVREKALFVDDNETVLT